MAGTCILPCCCSFLWLNRLISLMYSKGAKVGEKGNTTSLLKSLLSEKHYYCNTEAITRCSETAYMLSPCCVESQSASHWKAKNKDGLFLIKLYCSHCLWLYRKNITKCHHLSSLVFLNWIYDFIFCSFCPVSLLKTLSTSFLVLLTAIRGKQITI